MAIRTTLSLLALALATPVAAEPFYRPAPYDAPAYGRPISAPMGSPASSCAEATSARR